jgi:hypothetical protein
MTKNYTRYIFTGALALGLSLPLCSTARADHDYSEDCHHRLQVQKDKIDRDAAKYGEHSGQVNRDIAKLDEERSWCRDHHADWDHSLFDVGIYVRK